MEINEVLATKVLGVVDNGLVRGLGKPEPGYMCVEAAVCYALGEEHSDRPSCVTDNVRAWKIFLNDCHWTSDLARARGMRRLAIAQLGTNNPNFNHYGFQEKTHNSYYDLMRKHAIQYSSDFVQLKEHDDILSEFAENMVQHLIELKSPGSKFLYLTEGEKDGN